METENSSFTDLAKRSSFYQALGYEFLGTALVTWAFNLGLKDDLIRAMAFMAAYIIAYNVSGAHFNPAITIAVLIKEGEKNLIANIIFAFQIVLS